MTGTDVSQVRARNSIARDIILPVYDVREAFFIGGSISVLGLIMAAFSNFSVGVLLVIVLWIGRGINRLQDRPAFFEANPDTLVDIRNALNTRPSLMMTEENVWRNRRASFPKPKRAAIRLLFRKDNLVVEGPRRALNVLRSAIV